MGAIFFEALYIFFLLLEIILFIYFSLSLIHVSPRFKEFISILIEPVLTPVRFLLRHSIFNTKVIDFSPMIAFVVISFFQSIFYMLK